MNLSVRPLLFLLAATFLAALPGRGQAPGEIIPVSSPAFVFSPGNWTGDHGRAGSDFRQTWYPGAYFRVSWTTTSSAPTAQLLLDTSSYSGLKNKPTLTYDLDGVWTAQVPCADAIALDKLAGAGAHTLTVYVSASDQTLRWGTPGQSGLNIVKITGLRVDAASKPTPAPPTTRWALIVGDSITEGSAADFGKSDNLASWGYFVGQGLRSLGMDYSISACGWSGWLRTGDKPGDVPAYYKITGAQNGAGGQYDDAGSRWNKIDGNNHSLLDAKGHLSAYGPLGQEPALILINYGTNDGFGNTKPSDLQASITQALGALRSAAPQAAIYVIIPFGQYVAPVLKAAVAAHRATHPAEAKLAIVDLGEPAAKALAANGYWSGLHPNLRGHATFAAQILAQILAPTTSSNFNPGAPR